MNKSARRNGLSPVLIAVGVVFAGTAWAQAQRPPTAVTVVDPLPQPQPVSMHCGGLLISTCRMAAVPAKKILVVETISFLARHSYPPPDPGVAYFSYYDGANSFHVPAPPSALFNGQSQYTKTVSTKVYVQSGLQFAAGAASDVLPYSLDVTLSGYYVDQ